MFFAKGKPLVALDIGSYSIKLAHIKQSGKGYELLNYGMIMLPPDTLVDGEIDNPDAVVEALRNLIKSEKIRNKNIVLGLSGQSVIIKKISVPIMSEDDLAEMIREEAEQYIPFDIEEVNLDFQIVKSEGDIPEESVEAVAEDEEDELQMDVLIVAARKDTIQVLIDVAKEVGLKVKVVDLSVFALENAFEINDELDMDSTIALVNIGASMTNVNILENGVTAYSKDLAVGGHTITELIQKNLSIGFSDAEKLKLGNLFESFTKADIIPHVKTGIKSICEELESTFKSFAKLSNSKVSKIYLNGGTCQLEGIDTLIHEYLGTDVEIMNAFRNIHYNQKHFDPEYIESMGTVAAIPVGLALRMVQDK